MTTPSEEDPGEAPSEPDPSSQVPAEPGLTEDSPHTSWTPILPSVWSRGGTTAIELLLYLAAVVASAVVNYALGDPFAEVPNLNWWVGLVVVSGLHIRTWRQSQTPIGSYLDRFVTTTDGTPASLGRMAVRQIAKFGFVYAIPLWIFTNGPLFGNSSDLAANPLTVMGCLMAVAGVAIAKSPLRQAPWDRLAGTVVSESIAGDAMPELPILSQPSDLKVSRQRVTENNRARRVLFATGLSSVLISALIVWSIFSEAWQFVSAPEFQWSLLSDIGWFPRRNKFDLSTLFVGTLWITGIAMAVAGPVGLGTAIYLSEYASPRLRGLVKPIVETLASIPSVVLGFFAIAFISPSLLQPLGSALGIEIGIFSLLSAGIAVGILTVPIVASISEDAMRAVPIELREASYGLGARRATTAMRVVFPAALSGITAAFIVGISRAIGETMVVFIAAGGSGGAVFEADPTKPGQTITAAMASLGAGTDSVAGSGIAFQSLYFLGALLFILTFGLNVVSDRIVRRFRQVYE